MVDVDSGVDGGDHAEGTETDLLLGLYLGFLVVPPEQAAAERSRDNQKREHQGKVAHALPRRWVDFSLRRICSAIAGIFM